MTLPDLPAWMDYAPHLLEKARAIRLLAMDVDGVLTCGEIIYASDGQELKVFNVKDGLGLRLLRESGIQTAIITGRRSVITERRGEELGVDYIHQGVKDKHSLLEAILSEHQWTWPQVAYMGDDLPDLSVLKSVGLACCPSDAAPEVQSVCHLISRYPGGRGAIRELTDLLLYSQMRQLSADSAISC
ncbi:MAG: HAD hydrolase family protein [Candidatus Melainabacteria bacterium]|nr:HAD hydrolase family protein [Candidatus Melainabacteria bacterium]